MGHDSDDPKPINVNVTLTIQHDNSLDLKPLLTQLLTLVTQNTATLGEIKVTQQEMDALLGKIDTTTNHIASNVQTIATVDQKISDEIDAFIAANPAGTVLTDAQVAQLQSFADRTQATSDASDAQVAVLQAIAAKGAPVVPQPPPAPIGI
jgi:hypothetical protein